MALECKGWHQEAALRMLRNNLDPAVAVAALTIAGRCAIEGTEAG